MPDTVEHNGVATKREDVPTADLAADPRYWEFTPGAAWHGCRHVVPGYAMTDANKLTLPASGFERQNGDYAGYGVPARVVVQYLRENRIVAEKNDLNSILFLLTAGVESSTAGTLRTGVLQAAHDDNMPLEEVIPAFVRARPLRYGGMRLRDLCRQMHAFYREHGTSDLQRRQFRPEHFPTLAMRLQEAVKRLVKNDVDDLRSTNWPGGSRQPYGWCTLLESPPIVPGERLDERVQPMIEYWKVFERGSNLFPGFKNEIQAIYQEKQPDGSHPDLYLRDQMRTGQVRRCPLCRAIPSFSTAAASSPPPDGPVSYPDRQEQGLVCNLILLTDGVSKPNCVALEPRECQSLQAMLGTADPTVRLRPV